MESNNERELLYNTPKANWPKWRNDLYQNGWCIVPQVISKEKAGHYKNEFWNWVEQLSPNINRNDSSTWGDENFPGNIHGIFTGYSFGHNQFVWDLRSEENVVNVFKEIYNTEELLVSFDGGNLSRPQDKDKEPWWHVDQSNLKSGFYCVQGLMNLEECGEFDGGLVVYDGSHNKFAPYFKETGEECQYEDYYYFEKDPREMEHFSKCKEIKVSCEPGDLVLWDSRCIHWAKTPLKGKGNGKCRTVVYLCYQPRSFASQMDISVKQQAFSKKQMTTHWPSDHITLTDHSFVDNGDTEYKFEHRVDKTLPILSDRAKQLAGLKDYQ